MPKLIPLPRRRIFLVALLLLEYFVATTFLLHQQVDNRMVAAFSTTTFSSSSRRRRRIHNSPSPSNNISRRRAPTRKRTLPHNNMVATSTGFAAKKESSKADASTSSTSSTRRTSSKRSPPLKSTTTTNAASKNTASSTKTTNAFFPPSSSSTFSSSSTSTKTTTTTDRLVTGVVGNWESLHGNWVLRPYGGEMSRIDEPPRAVIHFLGGALVGAAPHITYRYLLEKLADSGFLIVATPYSLSFDHLATCDEVLTKFERLAPTLARQYGALPVVGIGHSCGALLHLLITCLFPDTPRAANALLSFNNKPISDAVPFFEEFFAPVFTSIAAPTSTTTKVVNADGSGGTIKVDGPSSNDSLVVGLKLAMAATQGQLPSDELLQEAQRVFKSSFFQPPPGFPLPLPTIPIPPPFFPFSIGNNNNNNLKIPAEIREAYSQWVGPSVSQLKDAGVLSLIHETIVSLEQIPKLVEEVSRGYYYDTTNGVANGARDFNPTPSLVRSAASKAYRARRTLILGYADDPIDESDEVEQVLREALSITRMRRPMVEIDVQRKTLAGGHEAPLVAPPLEIAERAEDLLGLESSQDVLGYRSAAATAEDLVRWLEEGNL